MRVDVRDDRPGREWMRPCAARSCSTPPSARSAPAGPGGLREVADQAGYARSVVYAIFPNRAALFAALSGRHAAAILTTVAARVPEDASERQRLSTFIDAVCEWVEDEPNLYRALGAQPLAGEQADGLFDQLAAITEQMLVANLAAQQSDPAAAAPWAHAMIGAVAVASAWWQRTGTMSRPELVEHLTVMCWEGGARLPLYAAAKSNP